MHQSVYGIAIYIYYSDHAPPHFHAICAEHDAEVELDLFNGDLIEGGRGEILMRADQASQNN